MGLLLLLLLTACLPAPPSPTPSPVPTLPPTPPPTPTPSPAGPLVTTLTLWIPEPLNPYGERPGAPLLSRRLDEFNETHPDLQVQVILKKSRGRGGVLDFLRTARAAAPSVLPDLVILDPAEFPVAAQSGLLQPLEPWLQADGPLSPGDFYPLVPEMGQVGESTYGIPLTVDLEHLAYRPALIPEPPVSWTAVLSAPASFLFPAMGGETGAAPFTLAQYMAAGGRWTDEAGKPVLDEEPLAAVLSFYARAAETGVISPSLLLSLPDAQACWEQFLRGEGGMAVVSSRRFLGEPVDDVAMAPLPTRDGRPIALAEGWMLALVTEDPRRQQAAMQLAAWLLEPTWYGSWTQAEGGLPVLRRGLEAWTLPAERRDVLVTLLESARALPPPAVRNQVGPALQRAVEAVLTGQLSPGQAAAQAARSLGR